MHTEIGTWQFKQPLSFIPYGAAIAQSVQQVIKAQRTKDR